MFRRSGFVIAPDAARRRVGAPTVLVIGGIITVVARLEALTEAPGHALLSALQANSWGLLGNRQPRPSALNL
ncbi:hypothetical protein [Nodosilinea sp. E11]|uniref:hypothetical protein n=1 Tax=Nodosilinea sp. E11 TaxID=3037479 RepID=UPI002934DFD9|nr:hypothetical protein [Nodosilinea sp. E11]WOD37864.1 hypothetical protein RRF56_16760 [Nodosilinea sp. E11]